MSVCARECYVYHWIPNAFFFKDCFILIYLFLRGLCILLFSAIRLQDALFWGPNLSTFVHVAQCLKYSRHSIIWTCWCVKVHRHTLNYLLLNTKANHGENLWTSLKSQPYMLKNKNMIHIDYSNNGNSQRYPRYNLNIIC